VRDAECVANTRNVLTMSSVAIQHGVRFQRLVQSIHSALKASSERFNVEEAVRLCYDEGDNEIFHSLFTSMLSRLQSDVSAEMMRVLQAHDVKEKLALLEAIISQMDRNATSKRKEEIDDKVETDRALQTMALPVSVTAKDFVRFQTHQRMLKENETIRDMITATETEIADLEIAKACHAECVDSILSDMKTFKAGLEKSADICSALS
jgi:Nnf1